MFVKDLHSIGNKPHRVRFAPSPTGELHLGSMRTALFNYLFARSVGGKFLLRIEDTDTERSKKEFETSILEDLKWLGINYDEEIVYQKSNEEHHKKIAWELLTAGYCYYCNCIAKTDNPDYKTLCSCETQNYKEGALRFKVKHNTKETVEFSDFIMGECKSKVIDLTDFIILRRDGTPTFNFAVVCDDYFMKITHVIRGNDHLSNTFKQCLLYDALSWPRPIFAHLPLIISSTGKKLSKREMDISLKSYKNKGILPEALISFTVRLGWSYKNQEIFSLDELLKIFPDGKLQKSPAAYNESKLLFQNKFFLEKKTFKDLEEEIASRIGREDLEENMNILEQAFMLLKGRSNTINQLCNSMKIFVHKLFYIEELNKDWEEKSLQALPFLIQFFQESYDDSVYYLDSYNAMNAFMETKKFVPREYQQMLRYAVTGELVGAPIMEICKLLGKENVILRVKDFSKKIERS